MKFTESGVDNCIWYEQENGNAIMSLQNYDIGGYSVLLLGDDNSARPMHLEPKFNEVGNLGASDRKFENLYVKNGFIDQQPSRGSVRKTTDTGIGFLTQTDIPFEAVVFDYGDVISPSFKLKASKTGAHNFEGHLYITGLTNGDVVEMLLLRELGGEGGADDIRATMATQAIGPSSTSSILSGSLTFVVPNTNDVYKIAVKSGSVAVVDTSVATFFNTFTMVRY